MILCFLLPQHGRAFPAEDGISSHPAFFEFPLMFESGNLLEAHLSPQQRGRRGRRGMLEEEEEDMSVKKFRMALGIGGNMPRRDVSDPFDTGTLMELMIGYNLRSFLQIEGGLGYTTGFLPEEGIVGIDTQTGRIVELRGSYLQLPIGLKLALGFRGGSSSIGIGAGVLYNRYAESLSLIDVLGLAARETVSRGGLGYYGNWTYDHFFSGQYGLGARVRYVWTDTSGENVGNILDQSQDDFDQNSKGETSDAWLSIAGALIYRF